MASMNLIYARAFRSYLSTFKLSYLDRGDLIVCVELLNHPPVNPKIRIFRFRRRERI